MSHKSSESTNSESTIMMTNHDDGTIGTDHAEESVKDAMLSNQAQRRHRGGHERQREQIELDEAEASEREEDEKIGWVELFFCGCFGREDRSSLGREQAGRTNPNE